MTDLYNQFTAVRDEQQSTIMLGLDPKTPEQLKKVMDLSHTSEGIVGFKPNLAFYQGEGRNYCLQECVGRMPTGMIRLLDLKSPDGAATNRAALGAYAPHFDAVTIAPAGGCIEETIEVARDLGLATFSMGVMSFPGVLREIASGYNLFEERIERAVEAGTAGFVLGATAYVPQSEFPTVMQKYRTLTSDKPITPDEMSDGDLIYALNLRNDLFDAVVEAMEDNPHLLALVPGFGRQGGNPEHFVASGIDLDRSIINAGSAVLKAEHPQEEIQGMRLRFNKLRSQNQGGEQ